MNKHNPPLILTRALIVVGLDSGYVLCDLWPEKWSYILGGKEGKEGVVGELKIKKKVTDSQALKSELWHTGCANNVSDTLKIANCWPILMNLNLPLFFKLSWQIGCDLWKCLLRSSNRVIIVASWRRFDEESFCVWQKVNSQATSPVNWWLPAALSTQSRSSMRKLGASHDIQVLVRLEQFEHQTSFLKSKLQSIISPAKMFVALQRIRMFLRHQWGDGSKKISISRTMLSNRRRPWTRVKWENGLNALKKFSIAWRTTHKLWLFFLMTKASPWHPSSITAALGTLPKISNLWIHPSVCPPRQVPT